MQRACHHFEWNELKCWQRISWQNNILMCSIIMPLTMTMLVACPSVVGLNKAQHHTLPANANANTNTNCNSPMPQRQVAFAVADEMKFANLKTKEDEKPVFCEHPPLNTPPPPKFPQVYTHSRSCSTLHNEVSAFPSVCVSQGNKLLTHQRLRTFLRFSPISN